MSPCYCVIATIRSYIQNRNLRKVLKCFPFSLDVFYTAHNDDMFQLVVVEVGGSQRHHEVPEPNKRTVGVCEQTDNHVTIEDSHGRLVTILQAEDTISC